MHSPLQITFRHMDPSAAVDARIREYAEKLYRYHDNVISCTVVFDAPHQHQSKGNLFHISVDVNVPGHEIVVARDAHQRQAHEDPYVAIRGAFEAVYKQLKNVAQINRKAVKHHELPLMGVIQSMPWAQDFGTIRAVDGRELYFHRNSVLNRDFETLKEGQAVRYHEEQGDMGPKASTVTVVD